VPKRVNMKITNTFTNGTNNINNTNTPSQINNNSNTETGNFSSQMN